MPLYFFDFHDAKGFHRDEIGTELSDFAEAREQAQALLPDIVREELLDGEQHKVTCDVRGETGEIVYRGTISYRGTRL